MSKLTSTYTKSPIHNCKLVSYSNYVLLKHIGQLSLSLSQVYQNGCFFNLSETTRETEQVVIHLMLAMPQDA